MRILKLTKHDSGHYTGQDVTADVLQGQEEVSDRGLVIDYLLDEGYTGPENWPGWGLVLRHPEGDILAVL